MDYLKNLTGGSKEGEAQTQNTASTEQKGSGGFMSGLSDKLNTAAGGGKESEKNEDYLDKGELMLSWPSTSLKCHGFHIMEADISFLKLSMPSSNTLSVRDPKTMNLPLSRRRMNRSPTSSGSSTKARQERNSQLQTNRLT